MIQIGKIGGKLFLGEPTQRRKYSEGYQGQIKIQQPEKNTLERVNNPSIPKTGQQLQKWTQLISKVSTNKNDDDDYQDK